MRKDYRIHRICKWLEDLWQENPDWRFTQLLYNYQIAGNGDTVSFYQEDDETLHRIALAFREIED